jgi:hypothetical protein
MKTKKILLSSAALVLFAGPALAQATTSTTTTHRHHVIHRVVNSMDARIDALEAEIHELRAEQSHQAQRTAEVQAQTAPAAQPQVTAAQFQALQDQVYEEQAAVKSTGSGWWDNTKIGGQVFFDLTDIDNKNGTVKNAQNGFHYDIKRFYLIFDHQFDDTYSAHLVTDATYDTSQCDGVTTIINPTVPPTATSTCSKTGASTSQLFIKKAYLEANYAPLLDVQLGSTGMPWIPFAESIYGYRYIENTLVDRFKYGNTTDWGVNINGSTGDDFKFEYSVSAVNGAGYKKPAFGLGTNRADGMDFEGRVDLRWDGFVLGAGGYDGKLGTELTPDTTHHDFTRLDAIAGYAANGFNVGLEYFTEKNFDTISTAPGLPTDHGDGYSAFAAYKFTPQWAVFGRYDWAKPQAGAAFQPHYDNRYFNVGVQFSPIQMIDLSLVYKHDAGSDGVFTDQDGTIGGTAANVGSGHYDEVGLFGQFKF